MSRRRLAIAGAAIATVAAAALPFVVRGASGRIDAATALTLLLAALGLWAAVGAAGVPSLGQGAFVGLGAYVTVMLRVYRHWDLIPAAVVAVVVATAAGIGVGAAVARFRPAFAAVTTWLAAWTFALAVDAFSTATGGRAGLLVPRPTIELDAVGGRAALGPLALYELAVAALVLTGLAFLALGRRYRPALALVREDVAAARAAGIPVERLRVGALTASATVGGLAGVLLVHLDGVTDPTRYGPLLSVKLFIVVVLGGVTTAWGPAIGLAAIAVVDRLADAITNAFGGATDRVQPLAAGVTLLVVLVVAGRGIVPEVTARLRRRARRRSGEREHVHPSPPHPFGPVAGTWLEAYDVAVAFGGVQALAGVDLVAEPAACHAVIGPNGSGKTTLLRVLAGVVRADQGVMWLGETEVTTFDAPARRRAGLARSVQRPAAAPGLTAVGHVIAAAEAARADGWFRSLVATPGARAERHRVESEARRALAAVGLTAAADRDVAELNAFARRLLQIAMTLVGGARVILLDEPSAGMRAAEEQHLHAVLTRLRNAGLTIVVVEHNLRLVAGIADEVTVLDAGQIIARGHPDEVVRDPAVVAAYLGDPDDS